MHVVSVQSRVPVLGAATPKIGLPLSAAPPPQALNLNWGGIRYSARGPSRSSSPSLTYRSLETSLSATSLQLQPVTAETSRSSDITPKPAAIKEIKQLVQALQQGAAQAQKESVLGEASEFTPGERVEALYSNGVWYLAKVVALGSDGRYTIAWEDGMAVESVKTADQLRQPQAQETTQAPEFAIGEKVEALYSNGVWYPATVIALGADGRYTVAWEDGMAVEMLKAANEVRSVDTRAVDQQALRTPSTPILPVAHVAVGTSYSDVFPYPSERTPVNGVLPRGVTIEQYRECVNLHQQLERSAKERREEERRLRAELTEIRCESDQLSERLSQVISRESHESIVEQLDFTYQQSISAQEERLAAQEQQIQQAHGDRVMQLESEICDRERQLVFARRRVQEAQSAQHLADLEKKRCGFLERHLGEQSKLWPALKSKQDELDHYRQVIGIYQDELRAATELGDVLRTEGNAWRDRVLQESSAAARRPQTSAPQLLSPSQHRRLPAEAILPSPAFPVSWSAVQAPLVASPVRSRSIEHLANLRPT